MDLYPFKRHFIAKLPDSKMRVFLLFLISICFSLSLGDLTAKVTFPDLPSMVSRNCKLPKQLFVEMVVGDQNIRLNLIKSNIQETGKVLLVKTGDNGKPEFVDNKSHGKNNGVLYHDNSHLAAVEVFCRLEDRQTKLSLEGTIELTDNRMYRIVNVGEHGMYTLVQENLDSSVLGAGLADEDEGSIQHRFKRTSTDPVIHQDIFIDIVALVHFSVYVDFYERSTETNPSLALADTIIRVQRHFAHLFNAVDVRFKTASEKININLAATIIETEVSGAWFENVMATETDPMKINASGLLNEMNVYRMTDGIPAHDHFTSFSSVDMYWIKNGTEKDIAGLATLSQICRYPGKTVSTVEFQGNIISDVRTTAHEIAHALGSPHDGPGDNSCDSADNYIMSGAATHFTNTNPYKFSQCSAEYFGKHVNTLIENGLPESLHCLSESLAAHIPDVSDEVLGQLKDTDEQCREALGPDSFHCKTAEKGNVCLYMYCMDPETSNCSKRYAAKGTTCGDRKWCDAGNCVFHPDAPRADPECLWGDQTSANCPDFIQHEWFCIDTNKRLCCETCKKYEPPCNLTASSCSSPQVFDDYLCECVEPTCGLNCKNGGTLNTDTCNCTCPNAYTGVDCILPNNYMCNLLRNETNCSIHVPLWGPYCCPGSF